MAKLDTRIFPNPVEGTINATALAGQDYMYKERVPVLSASVFRNTKLGQAINTAINIAGDPIGAILNPPRGVRTTEVQYLAPKANEDNLRPRGKAPSFYPKANDNDLAIKIYLSSMGNRIRSNSLSEPYLTMKYTPSNLDYQVNGDFKPLNIIGKDLQTYHYGGGEQTFVFEYCWTGAKGDSYGSALDKAKRLARLATGQGWVNNSPPIIFIEWGSGTNTPFSGEYFLVERAPFKPRIFTLKALDKATAGFNNNSFHPAYVDQTITLKRVR